MRRNFAKYSCAILILLMIHSCEKKTDWQLQTVESGKLVVDALITDEDKTQGIKITKPSTEINGTVEPVSGVGLTIYERGNFYIFSESSIEPGLYESEVFQGVVGKTYALVLEYNGFRDTAVATMEGVTPLKELVYAKNDSGFFKIYPQESDGAAMLEIYYDWSNTPDYCQQYGNCFASETFYTINYIDVIKEFAPKKQEIVFPPNTSVLRRKYSLSDDHQKFIRSLLIETEWRGGLFDVEHGNVESNFKNGTLGFFAVCMVLSDTTFVD